MTSEVRERIIILKQCGAKKRMLEKEARNKAKGLMKENPKVIVEAYECPHCHYWHIGRKHERLKK